MSGKASFLGVRETVRAPPINVWLDWDLLVHLSMMIGSSNYNDYVLPKVIALNFCVFRHTLHLSPLKSILNSSEQTLQKNRS